MSHDAQRSISQRKHLSVAPQPSAQGLFMASVRDYANNELRFRELIEEDADPDTIFEAGDASVAARSDARDIFLSANDAAPLHLRRVFELLEGFGVPSERAAEFIVEIEGYRLAAGVRVRSPLLGSPPQSRALRAMYDFFDDRMRRRAVRPDLPALDDGNRFAASFVENTSKNAGFPPGGAEMLEWARQTSNQIALPITADQSEELGAILKGGRTLGVDVLTPM